MMSKHIIVNNDFVDKIIVNNDIFNKIIVRKTENHCYRKFDGIIVTKWKNHCYELKNHCKKINKSLLQK